MTALKIYFKISAEWGVAPAPGERAIGSIWLNVPGLQRKPWLLLVGSSACAHLSLDGNLKVLLTLFDGSSRAGVGFTAQHSTSFNVRTALELIIRDGIEGLVKVRRLVESAIAQIAQTHVNNR